MNNQKENSKENSVFGVVVEALPNTMFRVDLKDEEKRILTYLSGKMRMHRIKVMVGDRVEIELDPYSEKGRIIKRL